MAGPLSPHPPSYVTAVRTLPSVKTVVLDANELSRDWMCTGLKYQLLEHIFHASWLNVYVPAVVLEELIANRG